MVLQRRKRVTGRRAKRRTEGTSSHFVSPVMRAVFLDRDGVINKNIGIKAYPKKLHIFKNSFKAIKTLNKKYKIIVVTNQPHVARGLCTEKDVVALNKWLSNQMKKNNAKIDAIYYCPHHPEQRTVARHAMKYRIACECRKPNIGMLKSARKKFKLDMKKCYMIGDRTIDIMTGRRAGCKTILVKTGKAGKDREFDVKPDYEFKDIYSAALFIDRNNK